MIVYLLTNYCLIVALKPVARHATKVELSDYALCNFDSALCCIARSHDSALCWIARSHDSALCCIAPSLDTKHWCLLCLSAMLHSEKS
jgi:hypothetical protein